MLCVIFHERKIMKIMRQFQSWTFSTVKFTLMQRKLCLKGDPTAQSENNWNCILTLTLTFYQEGNTTTLKKIRNAVLKDNLYFGECKIMTY